jgi:hypothetical protein
MIKEFIEFIKTYQFHPYKDGTWYTSHPKYHSYFKIRKFYKDEELEELFLESLKK